MSAAPAGTGPGPRIVTVGDLMTDVVATIDRPLRLGSDTAGRIRTAGGGSAANTAHWLAATGRTVAFVGRRGDDALGVAAVAELAAAGVEVRVGIEPAAATGTCVVLVGADGERTMIPDAAANLALRPEHLPDDLFVAGDHLHLSGYTLLRRRTRDTALAALQRARAAGLTTSIDAASAGPIADAGPSTVLDLCAGVDLLLANSEEARTLAGALDPQPGDEAGAERLADRLAALVVVKLGPGGAVAATPGGRLTRVTAAAATVVDSTGAGDAFAAGFLPALLGGADATEALARGTALAALALARPGARPRPGAPTPDGGC